MYAFVNVKGGAGRAFEKHCADLGKDPAEMITAMIEGFVADKNMPHPPPKDFGTGLDKYTGLYIHVRDTKDALKRSFDAEEKELKGKLSQIEMHLLSVLNEQGVENMRTKTATFYKETELKVSADFSKLYPWIMEDVDRFEFLERRVTRKAVETYMEDHGEVPPGVTTLQEYRVRVRRGKDS